MTNSSQNTRVLREKWTGTEWQIHWWRGEKSWGGASSKVMWRIEASDFVFWQSKMWQCSFYTEGTGENGQTVTIRKTDRPEEGWSQTLRNEQTTKITLYISAVINFIQVYKKQNKENKTDKEQNHRRKVKIGTKRERLLADQRSKKGNNLFSTLPHSCSKWKPKLLYIILKPNLTSQLKKSVDVKQPPTSLWIFMTAQGCFFPHRTGHRYIFFSHFL